MITLLLLALSRSVWGELSWNTSADVCETCQTLRMIPFLANLQHFETNTGSAQSPKNATIKQAQMLFTSFRQKTRIAVKDTHNIMRAKNRMLLGFHISTKISCTNVCAHDPTYFPENEKIYWRPVRNSRLKYWSGRSLHVIFQMF